VAAEVLVPNSKMLERWMMPAPQIPLPNIQRPNGSKSPVPVVALAPGEHGLGLNSESDFFVLFPERTALAVLPRPSNERKKEKGGGGFYSSRNPAGRPSPTLYVRRYGGGRLVRDVIPIARIVIGRSLTKFCLLSSGKNQE